MAPKTLVLAALLLVAVAAGQVPRCAGFGASSSTNASVVISGTVPCSTGSNINVASAAPFPNANVQVLCNGNAMAGATATTDMTGKFLMSLPGARKEMLTAIVANQCKLVVNTPLAACDASLAGAAGTLASPLKLLGISTGSDGGDLGGILGGIIGAIIGIINGLVGGIINLAAQDFTFA